MWMACRWHVCADDMQMMCRWHCVCGWHADNMQMTPGVVLHEIGQLRQVSGWCADDVQMTYVICQWNLTRNLTLVSSACHLHVVHTSSARRPHMTSTPKIFPVKYHSNSSAKKWKLILVGLQPYIKTAANFRPFKILKDWWMWPSHWCLLLCEDSCTAVIFWNVD